MPVTEQLLEKYLLKLSSSPVVETLSVKGKTESKVNAGRAIKWNIVSFKIRF